MSGDSSEATEGLHTASVGKATPAAIGFNELFIFGYARDQGYACPTCSTNSPPMKLDVIASYLDYLVAHGIRVHRDIVPVQFYRDPANVPLVATVIREFQKRNLKLILAAGRPIPAEISVTHDLENIIPADFKEWEVQSYTIANGMVTLLKGLNASPGLDPEWLKTNVIFEPFNEIDGLPARAGDRVINDASAGSPKRAAILFKVSEYAFRTNGLEHEITMPSIVNVYTGFGPDVSPNDPYYKLRAYLNDYYNVEGGGGRPNIHLYHAQRLGAAWSGGDAVAADLAHGLEVASTFVPETYRAHFIISETGAKELGPGPGCVEAEGALQTSTREQTYGKMVNDSRLNALADMIIYWRLFDLTTEYDGCESHVGVVHGSKSLATATYDSFKGVGLFIFDALAAR